MNLLKSYIIKVYEEKDVTDKYIKSVGTVTQDRIIQVDVEYDCYGIVERNIMIWSKNEWIKIKSDGYFFS